MGRRENRGDSLSRKVKTRGRMVVERMNMKSFFDFPEELMATCWNGLRAETIVELAGVAITESLPR